MADLSRPGAAAPERAYAPLVFAARDDGHGKQQLTDLGCPDCRGVLAVELLDRSMRFFRCSIGHAYDEKSLVAAKEAQLETSLWTAVEVYDELRLLHEELGRAARHDGREEQAQEYDTRAQRAATEATRLREIIASDTPPAELLGR
jgi:two-component system chemotaxis response regulator CheB